MNTVCVVGLGYIGLPTASLLATRGHRVHGVDVNPVTVETINRGEIPLKEPDLDILVRAAVGGGQLTAALEPTPSDVFVIAVPTPFTGDHEPDLSHVDAATAAIAPHLAEGVLVILESTSPVGTTERVFERLQQLRPDLVRDGTVRFSVAYCPERVLPGKILRELIENDRIVGGVNAQSTTDAVTFYRSFVTGEVLATDSRTAEMCKLVENSFRDLNIAFANELSVLCHDLGINVWELVRLANRHPRVSILNPGPGVGGHCLAVDPWFIISSAPEQARLIRLGREVNKNKAQWVVERVLDRAGRFRSPVVACLGIAYKPNIDDLRESPSLEIARSLTERVEGEVIVVDPNVRNAPEGVSLGALEETLERADIVVALVSHREFLEVDPEFLKDKVLIDAAGVFR